MIKRGIAAVTVFLLFFLLLVTVSGCNGESEPALPDTVEGSIKVPEDYNSIQEAIEVAQEGDVIVVSPGRYSERVDFLGKNITLTSTSPGDEEVVAETIIDAGGVGAAVVFESGETNAALLTGFTIQGGSGKPDVLEFEIEGEMQEVPSYYGGGIFINNESFPTITGNVIQNNVAARGGGIMVYGSAPVIEGNTIRDNVSEGGGGGVFLADSPAILRDNAILSNSAGRSGGGMAISGDGETVSTLAGNTISDNRADSGGGISVFMANPVLENNTIRANFSDDRGGGLYIILSSPLMETNNITDNVSGSAGGGVALFFESSPVMKGNIILDNSADNGGGIAVYFQSEPSIEGNTISGNKATFGGGLVVYEKSAPVFKDNDISGNDSDRSGAGAYIQDSNPVFESNNLIDNEARRDGGGIFALGDSLVVLMNNLFTGNRASRGGAVALTEGASLQAGEPDENIYEENVPDDIYRD